VYALFGALLVFGTAKMKNLSVWTQLLIVLFAAVIDGTIQIFSARESQAFYDSDSYFLGSSSCSTAPKSPRGLFCYPKHNE